MATTSALRKGLDRKVWQSMTPAPVATAAGTFIINDPTGEDAGCVYVAGVSSVWRYLCTEDAWMQLPNSGIAGTFGAGACGCYHKMGPSGTATAGTTTSITTNLTIPRSLKGFTIRFTAGPNAGLERAITSNTSGTNSVISFDACPVACTNATQYVLLTGRYWFFNPGTTAVGLAYWDRALSVWTQRAVTGLPTAWGTDGRLVPTYGSRADFVIGTATGGTTTTLVNAGKTWATNGWTNYQVRLTGGTGAGQVRLIASNTTTTLTVGTAFTTAPDATTEYVIEGADDYIYLLGNNAVALYRYSITGNTWTTISPTVARAGAPVGGMAANWVARVKEPTWNSESSYLNGRYIYSFRGNSNALDRYSIPENKWEAVTYGNQGGSISSTSCSEIDDDFIYVMDGTTNRFYRYDIGLQKIDPFSQSYIPHSTAVVGDKLWSWSYFDGPTELKFLYALGHTASFLQRVMVI